MYSFLRTFRRQLPFNRTVPAEGCAVGPEKKIIRKHREHIPDTSDTKAAAPILCAGITTYSPLRHWGVKAGSKVAVAGLGHMAVKIALALGAGVTLLTTSEEKRGDAQRLGAGVVIVPDDKTVRSG